MEQCTEYFLFCKKHPLFLQSLFYSFSLFSEFILRSFSPVFPVPQVEHSPVQDISVDYSDSELVSDCCPLPSVTLIIQTVSGFLKGLYLARN